MKKRLRISFNSPIILGFVMLCFGVVILGVLTKGISTQMFFMTYRDSLFNPLTYVRLFTHVLGHSGWDHFIGNMLYVLLIGPMLEEKYGSLILVRVIIVTALITGVLNNILFPNVGLCGASGVVFAFILMASYTSFAEGDIPLTFILVCIIYMGQQLIDGVLKTDDISHLSHIVGGIVGAYNGYVFNKKANT